MTTAHAVAAPCCADDSPKLQETPENTFVCIPPLVEKAQRVLRNRLRVDAANRYILDGVPASIREIVTAANAFIEHCGGALLAYPGLNSLYDRDAPQMRVKQRITSALI